MIVCCNCAYTDVIPEDTRTAVLAGLASHGANVAAVADLCGMAARRDPRLAQWARMPRLTIVACHPRAVRGLFDWAGFPLRDRGVSFLNMRTLDAKAVLKGLPHATPSSRRRGILPRQPALTNAVTNGLPRASPSSRRRGILPRQPASTDVASPGGWIPWFPVLDRARCVNCKQCVSFCAFGVYTVKDGTAMVANPTNCKTNCPACARMCPHLAIIFPKCPEEPIDGTEVTPAHIRQRRAMVKKPVHGMDMHALLAARSAHAAQRRK